MADKLDDLPEADYGDESETEALMNTMYGKSTSKSVTSKTNWKFILYTTGLFVLLSNPYVNDMLDKISYLEGSVMLKFAVRVVLFLVLYFFMDRFLK